MSRNLLITGANGQLGNEMRNLLATNKSFNSYFADIDTLAASRQLVIKNCGKSPLQIYGIRPAESCVTVDFDNGLSLGCGEKAAISVEVLPSKMEDKILNTYIIIYCNDPLHYKQAVRIVGNKK